MLWNGCARFSVSWCPQESNSWERLIHCSVSLYKHLLRSCRRPEFLSEQEESEFQQSLCLLTAEDVVFRLDSVASRASSQRKDAVVSVTG